MARRGPAGLHNVLVLGLVLGLVACDDKPRSDPAPAASATTAKASAPSAEPPAPPQKGKPQLAVDDAAAFVSGERVDLLAPDPKGRFATVLGTTSVSGEELVLQATREAKLPKVALVVSAVAKTEAKGLVVRTPRRDRSAADIPLSLRAKPDACAAVGFIGKDGSITAQTASGKGAARFTRGMAGPDLTRGSEGIRKLAASCESPVWLVSADESITWGLVVDLVLAVASPEDGGAPPKAREVMLLSRPPAAGKKLEAEE